ncbi:glycosyltransferase family 2 protein [Roseovarius aestuarii]|uniref:Glycosyl transferase family 2 n=1 Tax=Roseovarius aestuarii TaxID=475083 RepID=A0A1X7BT59_9RHOB|nr:glycosyltransferase family A protein [Roseovarius aestuarii]SMC12856.1 Glycosyl transferase family 2 [Roseovarius aestuarii]
MQARQSKSRVHIRTPTYRRPAALKRCLESMIAQTWENWVCDVYDDDPEGSAATVVNALCDPRITCHQNKPQRFASKNIDQCFGRANPCDADYFCVVEDDNFILPRFIEDNIRICRQQGVEIVFRNQLVEFESGSKDAHLSAGGILDNKLTEGRINASLFRMSLIADIGVSNGGLFWSRLAVSDLEIKVPCSATLQEYMRTFAIDEPIYIALEPLAVWAENGDDTLRDLGSKAGYLRSELSLKRSIGVLRRGAWARAAAEDRSRFLDHPAFAYPVNMRARGLVKSHITFNVGTALRFSDKLRLALRGGLTRLMGRSDPNLHEFISTRSRQQV